MKLVNYQLQNHIESLSANKPRAFFSEYVTSILQDTSKPYYQRADYVGLSMSEVKNKIDILSNDIKELQALKKRLSDSLDIAKEEVAKVFLDNGIDRIDGNIISSLTISKESSSSKTKVEVLDENAVMSLGYIKYLPDIEAIERACMDKDSYEELKDIVKVESTTTITPSKIKVNEKRGATTNQAQKLDELVA